MRTSHINYLVACQWLEYLRARVAAAERHMEEERALHAAHVDAARGEVMISRQADAIRPLLPVPNASLDAAAAVSLTVASRRRALAESLYHDARAAHVAAAAETLTLKNAAADDLWRRVARYRPPANALTLLEECQVSDDRSHENLRHFLCDFGIQYRGQLDAMSEDEISLLNALLGLATDVRSLLE